MVITRTPFRMSFVGGGTDYQPFFEEYGGSVISTTFDKYCYVTPPAAFFRHKKLNCLYQNGADDQRGGD